MGLDSVSNFMLVMILLITFGLSTQDWGEWKLTKFQLMDINQEFAIVIDSSKERRYFRNSTIMSRLHIFTSLIDFYLLTILTGQVFSVPHGVRILTRVVLLYGKKILIFIVL